MRIHVWILGGSRELPTDWGRVIYSGAILRDLGLCLFDKTSSDGRGPDVCWATE